jgi:hypothetical protein
MDTFVSAFVVVHLQSPQQLLRKLEHHPTFPSFSLRILQLSGFEFKISAGLGMQAED